MTDTAPREHGVYIGRGTVSFPCCVSVEPGNPNGHDGPCAARELPRTMEERARWSHERSGLGEFQGRPETTAQRYTENATPPPMSREQRLEQREVQRPPVLMKTDQEVVDAVEHLQELPVDPVHVDTAKLVSPSDPVPLSERRDRPEDQPLPEVDPTKGFIQDRLISLIADRRDLGIKRYGTALQAFNGRDAMRDVIEELVDATVYAVQVQTERDEIAAKVQRLFDLTEKGPQGSDIMSWTGEWIQIIRELQNYFNPS